MKFEVEYEFRNLKELFDSPCLPALKKFKDKLEYDEKTDWLHIGIPTIDFKSLDELLEFLRKTHSHCDLYYNQLTNSYSINVNNTDGDYDYKVIEELRKKE